MSWKPEMAKLQGLSLETAEKFGKPCVGAYYAGKDVRSNRLEEDARCAICGRFATNSHHEPPLGLGRGRANFSLYGKTLKPALIALCGSGTTGCHGKVHSGQYRITWEWDFEEDMRLWWSGEYPRLYANTNLLFCLGQWVVRDREGNVIKKIRKER